MSGAANPIAQWRERMQLSQRAAAAALGMSLRAYQQQERGRSWTDDRAMTPPLTLLLACAAIERGVTPIE